MTKKERKKEEEEMLDVKKMSRAVVLLVVFWLLMGQTVATHAQGAKRLATEPAIAAPANCGSFTYTSSMQIVTGT